MASLTDTIASFNPMNHFNRFPILLIVILVWTMISLLALKHILVWLHKNVKQHGREKKTDVFTVWTIHTQCHQKPNKRHMRSPPFRVIQETYKPLEAIAFTLGCPHPQRWKLSPYCWRDHALQTQGPEAPQLNLSWKPPPWGLAFMVPEGHASFQRTEAINIPT